MQEKSQFICQEYRDSFLSVHQDILLNWPTLGTSLEDLCFRDGQKVSDTSNMYLARAIWNSRLLEVLMILSKSSEERQQIMNSRESPRTSFYNLQPLVCNYSKWTHRNNSCTLKPGLGDLGKWTEVIPELMDAYGRLDQSTGAEPPTKKPGDEHHRVALLIWQIQYLENISKESHLKNVLENLSSVVLYISLFKAGQTDLPSTAQELRQLLTTLSGDQVGRFDADIREISKNPASRIRGCTYVALGASPLILQGKGGIGNTGIKRANLIQYWLHFGNPYPQIITQIELSLWTCIKKVVDGEMGISRALKEFLDETSSTLKTHEISEEDRQFFQKGFGEPPTENKVQPILASWIVKLPSIRGNKAGAPSTFQPKDLRNPNVPKDLLAVQGHNGAKKQPPPLLMGIGSHGQNVNVDMAGEKAPEKLP
ncbi:hypothetical protein V5O48_012110 [Marasmius crinis-equi]|uniref:Uncharacterized protein n=1 Tax=Marasmius crinis-equi TaxID=585013 RepID=A0ABR3F3N2_9AGAR